MMRVIDASVADPFRVLEGRSAQADREVQAVVAAIIEDVRVRGDEALLDNVRRFDSPDVSSLVATPAEIERAEVPENHLAAIRESIVRVRRFHQAQMEALLPAGLSWSIEPHGLDAHIERADFSRPALGQRILPLTSAGVYVPGGKATYPSSVIMNACPAVVAGVGKVCVATPARSDGLLAPAVLVALREVGITAAFKMGGAAAVAALALGTESVPRVDKIVGPGNRYVSEAKRQLWGLVGLDGYAGPSEVCVLADEAADPRLAAADLLTQVEHAEDNAGFLVALSRAKLDQILSEVDRQLVGAPREHIMRAALTAHGLAFVAHNLAQACDLINVIAPEHLSLSVETSERVLSKIQNAGCVLLGHDTPESAGDFCAGPSHTLPTAGAARYGSPVNVLDFLKLQSVCRLNREGLESLLPAIEAFAEMEGLPAHGQDASIRFEAD